MKTSVEEKILVHAACCGLNACLLITFFYCSSLAFTYCCAPFRLYLSPSLQREILLLIDLLQEGHEVRRSGRTQCSDTCCDCRQMEAEQGQGGNWIVRHESSQAVSEHRTPAQIVSTVYSLVILYATAAALAG
ncbi:hypothetical protein TYRP_022274 [Tyrophagus putrescentiae]|nr:hypothetical protein TYRP_022274 [Tyrophagus putrescentiae]